MQSLSDPGCRPSKVRQLCANATLLGVGGGTIQRCSFTPLKLLRNNQKTSKAAVTGEPCNSVYQANIAKQNEVKNSHQVEMRGEMPHTPRYHVATDREGTEGRSFDSVRTR
jgi:hypothetical protein